LDLLESNLGRLGNKLVRLDCTVEMLGNIVETLGNTGGM